MVKTNLGRVTFIPRGKYKTAEKYDRLDLVFHGGCSYVCLKNGTTGVSPDTSEELWMMIAEKGAVYWGDMTDEEKKQAASELGLEVFGFVPVLITQKEFDNLGENIDPETMYYIIED